MKRYLLGSLLSLFALACGGAASESPASTTAATSGSSSSSAASSATNATNATNASPAASATTSASATPYSSTVLAIPDPAAVDDKSKSLHLETPSGAKVQVSGATVNILAGPRFAMAVTEQGSLDLHEMVKAFGTPQGGVENAHVEKIKDDMLVYTGTDSGRAGYHFEALVQTANPVHAYACSDSGLLKVELTREDVDAMIRACKTLKR